MQSGLLPPAAVKARRTWRITRPSRGMDATNDCRALAIERERPSRSIAFTTSYCGLPKGLGRRRLPNGDCPSSKRAARSSIGVWGDSAHKTARSPREVRARHAGTSLLALPPLAGPSTLILPAVNNRCMAPSSMTLFSLAIRASGSLANSLGA